MAADYDGTDEFRGASFTGASFTGANFRDCDLRQTKITDSWLVDVSLSGLVSNLVVNDVDVTAFVEGELDKRHPERVPLPARGHEGGVRAPPLRGTRPRDAGSGPRRRAAHHDPPP